MEYRIEKLSAQNIHLLVPLYRAAFRESVSLPFLLKKYDTRSLGAEFIGFIAITTEGDAASYYGVIPCFFQLNGKTLLAAQSADTMTHPDHRKKGLFNKLALQTYELAHEQGIQFIFGFPNEHSLPGFVKLKWQFLPDQLQVFTLDAGGFGYARLLKKSSLLLSLYNTMLGRVLNTTPVAESFFEKKSDGVKHDGTFISYKTYNVTHCVTLNDTKLWLKADGKLKVGAVQGLTKDKLPKFLKGIKKLAAKSGCSEVIFMTSKHSSLYPILSEALPPKDAFPVGFLSLGEKPFSFGNTSFEYCDVDIF